MLENLRHFGAHLKVYDIRNKDAIECLQKVIDLFAIAAFGFPEEDVLWRNEVLAVETLCQSLSWEALRGFARFSPA